MITPRRVITAVVAISIFVFLFKSLGPSPQPAADIIETQTSTEDAKRPERPYPPPPPSRPEQKPKPKQKPKPQEQVTVLDISTRPLREKLRFHFPYDIEAKFPSFIWQTWKTSPSSGAFEERLRMKEASWTEKHPTFVHEVIVDDAAEHLIKYLFSSVPEVAEAYMAMPVPVLKADFFRYLILFARGGIYTDIDTEALKPAINWLPAELDQSSVGLIVGIEADPDREDWNKWYARRIQFCQWTIQSKPGHPVLLEIVAAITEKTLQMKKNKELVRGKRPDSISVMEYTGPGIWTDIIFSYFNNREYFDFTSGVKNISYPDFFGITEHKKVGDVIVLPITSFSPGVGQMGAGERTDDMAFVYHDFDGSWKPESERMKGIS